MPVLDNFLGEILVLEKMPAVGRPLMQALQTQYLLDFPTQVGDADTLGRTDPSNIVGEEVKGRSHVAALGQGATGLHLV